jgi:hypothetical protein
MRSIYDFIVEPLGERYDNTVKVGEVNLITNTSIESWKHVNKYARVLETPVGIHTPIKKGDTIVVHQNVFRTFYDMKGKKKNSRSFLEDNKFLCAVDQIYLYKTHGPWKALGDRCFVAPIVNTDDFSLDKTEALVGILKIDNSFLNELKMSTGDTIGFTPNSEWEFVVDNQLMYCMRTKDIVIKYEHKQNQKEYNRSWAGGC